MAQSEIMQKSEDLSEERERLLAREGSHYARVGDHRRLAEIDHSLGVLWDLRRRELAGEHGRASLTHAHRAERVGAPGPAERRKGSILFALKWRGGPARMPRDTGKPLSIRAEQRPDHVGCASEHALCARAELS